MEQLISHIVEEFYKKAISDVMIGHQFRKIQEFSSHNPLDPPFEAFRSHIPRINSFWKIQLLGHSSDQTFNLIKAHEYLKIRKGELGRWIVLFKETLKSNSIDKNEEELEFLKKWEEKIDQFHKVFIEKLF